VHPPVRRVNSGHGEEDENGRRERKDNAEALRTQRCAERREKQFG
jgi:hypothetical protein